MSEGLDLLIHRHLEGTLGEEEAKALEGRLRTDPAARRRLAEMAFDHAQLKDLLESAGAVSTSSWSRWHWVAAASILLAVGVALAVGPFRSDPTPTPESSPAKENPVARREGFQGFRGRVYARVLERRDKARVAVKVGEVLTLRDGSQAADPGRLVGESIFIAMPRAKEGDSGPEKDHAAFLMKLQPGQEVVLELRHAEGTDFAIASLTADQVEWSRREDRKKAPGEKPAPPKDGEVKKSPVKDAPKKDAPREGDRKSESDER